VAKKKKRTAMRKLREVLRMHFDNKLSNQQIADALRMSKTNVYNSLSRFKESELTWPIAKDMPDTELEAGIYSGKPLTGKEDILPDVQYIQEELTRPHITLELLWNEYAQDNPQGLSRSSFYRHYQSYRKGLSVSMKIIHKGGEKVFVDYSGDGLRYYNRDEGGHAEVGFDEARSTYNSPGWARFQANKNSVRNKTIDGTAQRLGADRKSSNGLKNGLKQGMRIFHQKFGYGRVTQIDGDKLSVSFDKAGAKKVMAGFVEKT